MSDRSIRQEHIARAGRIVVKIGSASLTDESGELDRSQISHLAAQVAKLRAGGVAVTLVTSGAIATGLAEMGMRRPTNMPMLQAVAAVGQGQLMRAFHDAFARRGVATAGSRYRTRSTPGR